MALLVQLVLRVVRVDFHQLFLLMEQYLLPEETLVLLVPRKLVVTAALVNQVAQVVVQVAAVRDQPQQVEQVARVAQMPVLAQLEQLAETQVVLLEHLVLLEPQLHLVQLLVAAAVEEERVLLPELLARVLLVEQMFGAQVAQVALVAQSIRLEHQDQPQQVMETGAVEVAEQEQQLVLRTMVAQEQLEQFLSTGKLPDPNDLPFKMYAVVKNGIVQGYTWEITNDPSVDFVLMTYENSPAWIGGTYENGKFYELKGNI